MNALNNLTGLTWDDLRLWAGSKILNRGKSYQKNVHNLNRTEEGALVAWVSGSEEYATWVKIDAGCELDCYCTCPYDWGDVCKHEVAVVIATLARIKKGEEIPLADPDGELLAALLNKEDVVAGEEWEEESLLDKKAETLLRNILKTKKKDELLELLMELAAEYPEVRRTITENDQLQKGDTEQLVQSLVKEIEELAEESAWYNSWNDEGHLPDYSHVKKQLGALLDGGHADAVLEVGCVLWERGCEHVEDSHDDGDLADEIIGTMDIVFQAVPLSSLSRPEQLLWVIEILLEDQYGLGDAGEKLFHDADYRKKDWLAVAEELEERLTKMSKPKKDAFSATFQRERLVERLQYAYEHSGQQEQVVSLLEREVRTTQCYGQLVDTLLAKGETEKARQWCVEGFSRTQQDKPGIASSLQTRLCELAARENDFDLVAAYHAQDFFEQPSRNSYMTLQKAAENVDCWEAVRILILEYLESGRRPDSIYGSKKEHAWPLPFPEVSQTQERWPRRDFPDINRLIDIAILEQRLDDVVTLYQKQGATNRWGFGMGKEVAQAVSGSHPEVALGIWVKMVEDQIRLVKPKAYEVAAVYLRKMHKVYKEIGQLNRWQRLLNDIRVQHKAKRRLMEVLDGLEGKRILD